MILNYSKVVMISRSGNWYRLTARYGYNVSCTLERLWLMINFLLELAVKGHPYSQMIKISVRRYFLADLSGAPNDNFWKISVRKYDLRSRIFGTFVVKFLACLPLLGFSNPPKRNNCPFLTDFYPKKVTYNFREPFSWLKFSKRWILTPIIFGSLDFQLGNPLEMKNC